MFQLPSPAHHLPGFPSPLPITMPSCWLLKEANLFQHEGRQDISKAPVYPSQLCLVTISAFLYSQSIVPILYICKLGKGKPSQKLYVFPLK